MARQCTICGKSSQLENKRKLLRGHYNPTGKKRKYPNLQWLLIKNGSRVKACTQCMRTRAKSK